MIKRFSRPLQALSVAAVMSLAAVGVQSVQAQARPDAPPAQGKDQGPGRGERMQPGPGFGPGMPGGPGPMFLDGRILKDVGASEAQRKQIRDIFEAAHKDLKAQHEGGRQLHDQLEALMTAPTVDAAAVEQLRQQMTAQHEAASKRISQAMVDAAKVLTAEQRAKLAVELKKHKARMEKRMEHLREQGGRGGPRGGDGPHGDHDMDPPPPPKG